MPSSAEWIRQAAAFPVKAGQICLITSRSGKRWVIPKGLIDPGMSAAECALQEAWEEAGLAGKLAPGPLGSYLYEKYGGTCHVTVFFMEVTHAADDWPERGMRQREWLETDRALERIEDEGLREIFRSWLSKEHAGLVK